MTPAGTRRWALVSAAAAPVFLIGGWTLAAAHQPHFDPVSQTISALAARDATDRWIMTAALALLGVCHMVTAAGLRPAATAGRVVLGTAGLATVLVAVFPLPAMDRSSAAHSLVAGVAFAGLALWPALAWRRGTGVPWGLRRAVSVAASLVLIGLVGWFAASMSTGDGVGLTERIAAEAEALWPLAVVLTSLRRPGSPSL